MASVQDHYDRHLGPVYIWMAGGFNNAVERGAAELEDISLTPSGSGVAVDLGAGFGMHSIPLANRTYNVLAVDSCIALIDELNAHKGGLPIRTVHDDLMSFRRYLSEKPELILCMGDTLTHLTDMKSVEQLIMDISNVLHPGGRFIASFRDYTVPLKAEQRFIPVRNDDNRILTCFLEYADSFVTVHDILHEREKFTWRMNVSSYIKQRISPEWFMNCLGSNGFSVRHEPGMSGMIRFIAHRV